MTRTAAARTTIYALSSGLPPAAIAVVRISGPQAGPALWTLAGRLPPPRRATLGRLRDAGGATLDQALLLWFPGPATATGEDLVELHLHGGRAVIAAVLAALADQPGLAAAEPGGFTRRAFLNGRIDLAAAEGLADLLAAETEGQRRQAIRQAEGGLGRLVATWRDRVLALAASVEAAIEFGDDEDDVRPLDAAFGVAIDDLVGQLQAALHTPPAERLRDGIRIVLAGPVNAGKSSLINAMAGRDAAIVSDTAGTTRDLIEVPVQLGGLPCILIDGAGLRPTDDPIEALGVARSRTAIGTADILLWLGEPTLAPSHPHRLLVRSKIDAIDADQGAGGHDIDVSAVTGAGLPLLIRRLVAMIGSLLPGSDVLALNQRQRLLVADALSELVAARGLHDPLLIAEHLRATMRSFDRTIGRSDTDAMLDALFGRFCIGK